MGIITIIGTGNMARTIGALAVAGGNTVEVMGRDQSKAADLAKALGGGATTGEWGAVPAGDIVIVALLYDGVVPVVAQYGDALTGKIIVDISIGISLSLLSHVFPLLRPLRTLNLRHHTESTCHYLVLCTWISPRSGAMDCRPGGGKAPKAL